MVKKLTSSNPVTQSTNRRLQIVFGVLTNNYLLLLVLLLLSEMILRLLLANHDIYSLRFHRRIDEAAESLLQMTTNTIQVEVEAVDKRFKKEIEYLRNQLCEMIDENDAVFRAKLHDLYERVENVERSLNSGEWIRKDELNEFLEKFWLKKRKNEQGFNEVEEIIKREIEKHAADGIGRIDYAVESGGAMVVKHSEPYEDHKRFTRDGIHVDAHKILQPSFGEPGQCFSLKGNNGYVQIRLRQPIIPEAITLEHLAKSVAYNRSSAPKDCRVFGWFHNPKVDAQMMVLLAYFSYDLEKTNVQTFTVFDKDPFLQLVNTIRLDFTSNHGNPTYTCIYRVRVHGHELDSLSAVQLQIPGDSKNDSNKVTMILQ